LANNSNLISLDPGQLANRFAGQEVPIDELLDELIASSPEEEEYEGNAISMSYEALIRPLLDLIPPREADLIDLYYIQRKKQADIAEIFEVTQAAVSYRLDRGIQRLKFFLSVPRLTEEELREDLPKVPFKPIDVDIMVGMWKTTCQSEVAKQLGLTQGLVRHRFFVAVKLLTKRAEENPEQFDRMHQFFLKLSQKGFNVGRAVQLPQWSKKGMDSCG
jgi:predicted DNA-binding protein YlxM (UPF0122 family)